MPTAESIAIQKAEADAAELAVLKSIDDRLAAIADKLGIVDEAKTVATDAPAAPVAPTPAPAPSPTKPPAFKPVTK